MTTKSSAVRYEATDHKPSTINNEPATTISQSPAAMASSRPTQVGTSISTCCPFIEAPPEIHNRIYDYIFAYVESEQYTSPHPSAVALISTCRQIHAGAAEMYRLSRKWWRRKHLVVTLSEGEKLRKSLARADDHVFRTGNNEIAWLKNVTIATKSSEPLRKLEFNGMWSLRDTMVRKWMFSSRYAPTTANAGFAVGQCLYEDCDTFFVQSIAPVEAAELATVKQASKLTRLTRNELRCTIREAATDLYGLSI